MNRATVVEKAVAVPFGIGSALRKARVFHPQGFLCRGSWAITDSSPLAPRAEVLQPGAQHAVLARASRGAGFPEALPDFLAIAVRLVDAYGPERHQDLLINTSSGMPLLRHLFLPAPRWYAQTYSTCLPYRAGAETFLIGLLPPDERGPAPSLADMRAAVARGTSFGIAVGTSTGGWSRVGTLRLEEPLPAETGDADFDPWNTGGGLEPASWLNRLRREAYKKSRSARGRPAEGSTGIDHP